LSTQPRTPGCAPCAPRFWQSFRDSLAHLYTVSLADPLEEARFSLSSRTHPTLARS
jgi:hypothetical protein